MDDQKQQIHFPLIYLNFGACNERENRSFIIIMMEDKTMSRQNGWEGEMPRRARYQQIIHLIFVDIVPDAISNQFNIVDERTIDAT